MNSVPIQLDQLSRYYGDFLALNRINVQVEEGEVFGFLGPNGAGKTTAIRVLMGLLKPSSGTAQIFGLDCWRQSPEVHARVGFLPGNIQLYPKLTAREFLEFFSAFRDQAADARRRDRLAERLDLNMDRKISQLSKGNQQKVGIIQALMHDALLLILDEPTSGLDPLRQHDFLDMILEEQSRGKTIFLSSHSLNEVERVATRVGIIREGNIIAVESVDRLKHQREREMLVTLERVCGLDRLLEVDGVRILDGEPDKRTLRLGIRGEVLPVIKVLATLPVKDLVYGPPDLESVFMHYYEHPQQADSEAALEK